MSGLIKNKDLMKNYKMAITKTNKLTGKKGVYAIPSEISSQSPNASADGIDPLVENYVRWDAYKKAGYPTINTLDDLIPALKKMQSNTPKSDSGKKTYAISLFKDWDGETMMAASNYASLYGYKNTGFVFSKADGSEHQDAIDSNGIYVKALKFLFKANQAGLIDPESTTQNYDMLSDKYRDGQILSSLWSYQGSSLYNIKMQEKDLCLQQSKTAHLIHQDATLKVTLRQSLPSEVKPKIHRDLQISSTGCTLQKVWNV